LGRFEALGLRDEKLVGAPIESDPGIICDVRARVAATLADGRLYSVGSEDASGTDAGCSDLGKRTAEEDEVGGLGLRDGFGMLFGEIPRGALP
jgi:hypothetical protein